MLAAPMNCMLVPACVWVCVCVCVCQCACGWVGVSACMCVGEVIVMLSFNS